MHQTALLCLNGDPPEGRLFEMLWAKASFLMAADGGANWVAQYGHVPDLVIGDMDSLLDKDQNQIERLLVKDQSKTDGEKALEWLGAHGFKHVLVVGALGGRADFCLYNLSLPLRYSDLQIRFYHQQELIYYACESESWEDVKQSPVSLIPYGGAVSDVSTKGLIWELKSQTLRPDGLSSQSNCAAGGPVQVDFHSGHLLVYRRHHLKLL